MFIRNQSFCLGLYGFEQLILYYASHTEQEESEEKSGYFMLKKMLDKRKLKKYNITSYIMNIAKEG